MSLLTICQDASSSLGLEPLSSVVANTNETAQRLYRLANRSGKALLRRHDWQVLTMEHTFTTVAAEEQTDTPVPADFDRFITGTFFNRTSKDYLQGPLSAQEWAEQKNLTAAVITDGFRLRGDTIIMIPIPTAGETIAYEYVSKYWVDTDADDTGDAFAFSADADASLLDEEMITLDVMWRYLDSAGLSYAEKKRDAELMIADRMARDGGKRIIDLGYRKMASSEARRPTIPEGGWSVS